MLEKQTSLRELNNEQKESVDHLFFNLNNNYDFGQINLNFETDYIKIYTENNQLKYECKQIINTCELEKIKKEIIYRSKGQINTIDIFQNNQNWTDEREKLHNEIINNFIKNIYDLSNFLNKEVNPKNDKCYYLMRGNSASGKSTLIKKMILKDHPEYLNGVINPDIIKSFLQEKSCVFGELKLNNNQVHKEGVKIYEKIIKEIDKQKDLSLIFDKRFDEDYKILELMFNAEEEGKKIRLYDIDCPLELSLIRILSRKTYQKNARPTFSNLAETFINIKKNRIKLLDFVLNHPDLVHDYKLFIQKNGNLSEIANKNNTDENFCFNGSESEFEFKKIISQDHESYYEEVEKIAKTVINEETINLWKEEFSLKQKQIDSLKKYLGLTLKEAIDNHSKKINEIPPNFQDYQIKALKNLNLMSRTASSGKIDTSASITKKDQIIQQENAELTKKIVNENYNKAIYFLYKNRKYNFKNPEELKLFIEQTAKIINSNITKEDNLYRSGEDSKKYNYTKIAEIPERLEDFVEEMFLKLNNPETNPFELAAFCEYRINLKDHFFADGCGKISQAIANFCLMRYQKDLPSFEYKNTNDDISPRSFYFKKIDEIRQESSSITNQVLKDKNIEKGWIKFYSNNYF